MFLEHTRTEIRILNLELRSIGDVKLIYTYFKILNSLFLNYFIGYSIQKLKNMVFSLKSS